MNRTIVNVALVAAAVWVYMGMPMPTIPSGGGGDAAADFPKPDRFVSETKAIADKLKENPAKARIMAAMYRDVGVAFSDSKIGSTKVFQDFNGRLYRHYAKLYPVVDESPQVGKQIQDMIADELKLRDKNGQVIQTALSADQREKAGDIYLALAWNLTQ